MKAEPVEFVGLDTLAFGELVLLSYYHRSCL
jgi:hypothetical protein